jgi:hypothetical protein
MYNSPTVLLLLNHVSHSLLLLIMNRDNNDKQESWDNQLIEGELKD